MENVSQNTLAGFSLPALRERYRRELFDEQLPFWDRFGIDHEHGGFMCSLGYDGTRVNDDKFVWFQGRGLWLYSFVYNHLRADPAYLEVARKTKDFLLAHAQQADGSWAGKLSREGRLIEPERDVYGRYFAAEGLLEYARAAADERARTAGLDLFKTLFDKTTRAGAARPRIIPQGFWMLNVNIARQFLECEADSDMSEIAGRAVDAVLERHYQPDLGLNTENLCADFSRPPGEESKCNLGHSIETLWMVMEEVRRRGDRRLAEICADRIHHHLDRGWDALHGGLAMWINAGHKDYQWPIERVPGTDLEFHAQGEFNYTKTLWSLDETLIATLKVIEQSGAGNAPAWAVRYFELAQSVIDEKFSMQSRFGQPTYVLFAGRAITPPPCSTRQDNYHRPRALAVCITTLDRMTGATSATGRQAATPGGKPSG